MINGKWVSLKTQFVIPAKARIHGVFKFIRRQQRTWIPAFAGMTRRGRGF